MNYLKSIFLIAILTVGVFGINQIINQAQIDQNDQRIEFTDDLISEVRNVSGFDGVDIGGTITAKVTVGQNFSVVVEAEKDILPKIITKVKNNDLIVKFEKGFWKNRSYKSRKIKVRVTISLPALEDLDVSGASKASVSGVNSDKLTIDVSGASNVNIEGSAREIEVDLSGASSLMAKSLLSEVAEMDLSGASSAKINVTNSIRVDASGASSVRYLGDPQVQKDTSGASSIRRL